MRTAPMAVLVALCCGCTNAPIAGFLDLVAPARPATGAAPDARPPRGPEALPPPAGGRDVLPPGAETIPPVGPRGG